MAAGTIAAGLALAGAASAQTWRLTTEDDLRGTIVLVSGRTEAMLKSEEVVHDLWRNGSAPTSTTTAARASPRLNRRCARHPTSAMSSASTTSWPTSMPGSAARCWLQPPRRRPLVVDGARHALLIETDALRSRAMGLALDFFSAPQP